VAWTDERLDDLSGRMDIGFERVDRDIRDLRGEMHAGFAAVRDEMQTGFAAIRSEMHTEFSAVRGEASAESRSLRAEIGALRTDMDSLRVMMIRTLVAGFASLIVADVVRSL
jgi:hypothetical protein